MSTAWKILLGLALAAYLLLGRLFTPRVLDDPLYTLKGGETIAIRSLATGKYLEVQPASGRVLASAASSEPLATRWRVLLLDTDTVAALLRSAQKVDERSTTFTGRRMVSQSGCTCSGFSNAHGFGRFCHPWEDPMQEEWCYVNNNCSSATSRGSFGRRYEACGSNSIDPDDEYARMQSDQSVIDGLDTSGTQPKLVPASGCNCSGASSALGYGASCRGWEYEGQTPWCYVARSCSLASGGAAASRWARTDNGSFGLPYEQCVWRSPGDPLPGAAEAAATDAAAPMVRRQRRRRLAALEPAPRRLYKQHEQQQQQAAGRRLQQAAAHRRQEQPPLQSAAAAAPGRQLQAPSRISQLLASSPESERYFILVSALSHTFMMVEPPPHKEALLLSARSDELSMRSIFSSFERTKLLLALSTNSLLNVCDEASGEVCTGSRPRRGETLKLLRAARRTARFGIDVVS